MSDMCFHTMSSVKLGPFNTLAKAVRMSWLYGLSRFLRSDFRRNTITASPKHCPNCKFDQKKNKKKKH
jgi:hypothetical protein